jgi:RNA-directed DNA polymerase
MNTASQPMYEWNTIPWAQAERAVFKLQKRIYQASQRGETQTVHKLQRLLMKSRWACLLAVRRVTQDNQGKKTAGVDGVKSLTAPQRLALAQQLQNAPLVPKSPPVRRVWIPKPGTTEQRPLGIPVMEQRARQALVKLALEPEWEARFEPNSYGFRPGRSAHDAIEAIFTGIRAKAKYVLDADIAKCFDRINHAALLAKLQTFPKLRQVIKAWLQAGIMEGGTLFPSSEGVPQGGVVSPLLTNITLHGLETAIAEHFQRRRQNRSLCRPLVIRYADDLVVLEEEESIIHQVKDFVSAWLAEYGLELKPSKTQITHTLTPYNGRVGFDFLGFTIRQFPVGKKRSARSGRGQRLGFKTIIKPSKENIKRQRQKLAAIVDQHKQAPQAALISRLNPVIRGWANYYATVCSKETLHTLDCHLFHKLWAWARRRHPRKGKGWRARRYWTRQQGSWGFAAGEMRLCKASRTPIRRHIKVQSRRSPFDGEWVYWATRRGEHPEAPAGVGYLLKRQRGRCAYCGLYFAADDQLEEDHIHPRNCGGTDNGTNRQLLHRHCHDQKTAHDGSCGGEVLLTTAEKPRSRVTGKLSRPVLQTSRPGDGTA